MLNKSSLIGVTSGLAFIGMAAGLGVSAVAHDGNLALPVGPNIAGNSGVEQPVVMPTPVPTITVTSHPVITAAPVEQTVQTPVDGSVGVPESGNTGPVYDSGSTTVQTPVEQPAAPAPVAPAPVVQPPAPVVQPPATNTNTGAS